MNGTDWIIFGDCCQSYFNINKFIVIVEQIIGGLALGMKLKESLHSLLDLEGINYQLFNYFIANFIVNLFLLFNKLSKIVDFGVESRSLLNLLFICLLKFFYWVDFNLLLLFNKLWLLQYWYFFIDCYNGFCFKFFFRNFCFFLYSLFSFRCLRFFYLSDFLLIRLPHFKNFNF